MPRNPICFGSRKTHSTHTAIEEARPFPAFGLGVLVDSADRRRILGMTTSHRQSTGVVSNAPITIGTSADPPLDRQLPLSDIEVDADLQLRVEAHDPTYIQNLSQLISDGIEIQPVVVYADDDGDSKIRLVDGHARYEAYRTAKRTKIPAKVYSGGKRDALFAACGANATHGKSRTDSDKRRAVETMLSDPEWRKLSQGLIARHCGVTQQLVSKIATKRSSTHNSCESIIKVGADGRKINTERIGRKASRQTLVESSTEPGTTDSNPNKTREDTDSDKSVRSSTDATPKLASVRSAQPPNTTRIPSVFVQAEELAGKLAKLLDHGAMEIERAPLSGETATDCWRVVSPLYEVLVSLRARLNVGTTRINADRGNVKNKPVLAVGSIVQLREKRRTEYEELFSLSSESLKVMKIAPKDVLVQDHGGSLCWIPKYAVEVVVNSNVEVDTSNNEIDEK